MCFRLRSCDCFFWVSRFSGPINSNATAVNFNFTTSLTADTAETDVTEEVEDTDDTSPFPLNQQTPPLKRRVLNNVGRTIIAKMNKFVRKCVFDALHAYHYAQKKRIIDASMKTLEKRVHTEKTNEALALIAQEPPVDHDVLESLIDQKINSALNRDTRKKQSQERKRKHKQDTPSNHTPPKKKLKTTTGTNNHGGRQRDGRNENATSGRKNDDGNNSNNNAGNAHNGRNTHNGGNGGNLKRRKRKSVGNNRQQPKNLRRGGETNAATLKHKNSRDAKDDGSYEKHQKNSRKRKKQQSGQKKQHGRTPSANATQRR